MDIPTAGQNKVTLDHKESVWSLYYNESKVGNFSKKKLKKGTKTHRKHYK